MLTALFAVGANFVLAQDLGTGYAANLDLQGTGGTDIRVFIVNIVRFFLTFVGIIAVIMIMYGGFIWMTSAGDASKVDRAKRILISASIGLIITLSAFAIVTFVINTTSGALTETCEFGVTPDRNCGCYDGGTQTCQADNTWGSCTGPCLPLEVCCAGGPVEFCSTDCSVPPSFLINSNYPLNGASNVIRNAKIRFNFNRNVQSSTVDDTTFIVTDGSGTTISGTRTVSGKRITFIPSGICGANSCGATNCFANGETVNVEVVGAGAGVLSAGGIMLDCAAGEPCTIQFTVGDLIDCDNPSVALQTGQICTDTNNELYASASDDSSISNIEFYINGVLLDDVNNAATANPFNTYPASPVNWTPIFAAGTTVNIRATAYDVDDHSASDSTSKTVRAGHCCNGTLDTSDGETGVDCGGECASCDGAACGASLYDDCSVSGTSCSDNNDRCSSGLCDCTAGVGSECQDAGYQVGVNNCCLCQSAPVIDWITPQGGFCYDSFNTSCQNDSDCSATAGVCDDLSTACSTILPCVVGTCNIGCSTDIANGATGNLITIGGRWFGDYDPTASMVEIYSGSAWIEAELASTTNENCQNSWTQNQIIAVVPGGLTALSNSNIRVTSVSSYNDESQDDRGPFVDFITNNIIRPGLCSVVDESGLLNDLLTYEGINLLGSQAFFGNQNNNTIGLSSSFIAGTNGTAGVPNIGSGRTSTFASNAGVMSNFLDFTKLAEPRVGPRIISFATTSGAVGQYVTIYGEGFGNSRGIKHVYFDLDGDFTTNADQREANYTFPEICADSLWKDNQIIVKAPVLPTDPGNYYIIIDLGTERIDTSALTPSQFAYNSALPLSPSLCKIDPDYGPNNSPITLYGEYFGVAADTVFFHLNHNQSGAAIISWSAEKIETTIHPEAASGPVYVKQGALSGNSLNLQVGMCTDAPNPTEACGGDFCCGVGTSEEGRCHATEDECYADIPSSVYEWDFTTEAGRGIGDPCYDGAVPATCDISLSECGAGLVCDISDCTCQVEINESDSCNDRARRTGSCNPYACPNSPGTCSPYDATGETINTGVVCTDASCGLGNVYNDDLNRCTDDTDSCSLASTTLTTDILGRSITAYCADDGGANHWFIDTNLSCPNSTWQKLLTQCVLRDGSTCDLCAASYDCRNDNDGDFEGLCTIGGNVCPAGSSCQAGVCVKDVADRCECCCEIGEDARDCCEGLTCEGTCGDDITDDGSGFGLCTGCAEVGSTQAEHNAACNCSGTGGKYCDTSAAGGRGVCTDCALLSTPEECSANAGTCCVDAANNNNCRGGEGTLIGALNPYGYTMTASGGNPAYAYCSYYECNDAGDACSTDAPAPVGGFAVASSTVASSTLFNDADTCEAQCVIRRNLNDPCDLNTSTLGACDSYTCNSAFGCFSDDVTETECGSCCCEVGAGDNCSAISPLLECRYTNDPNNSCHDSIQGTAPDFGICCGCVDDDSCGNPTSTGCGNDTCCHSRPNVTEVVPEDMGPPENIPGTICRNAKISVTFDTPMNIGSYTGNIIVVGDYGSDQCPEGTQYLAIEKNYKNQNIFARIFNSIKNFAIKIAKYIMPTRFAKAYFLSSADHNYCAISGAITGYNTASEGVLEFSPIKMLDGDRWYYVIIKGDEDLNSRSGVKNIYNIAMNGTENPEFNGIIYPNSYVWSFKTLSMYAPNNGACDIDHVDISPSSYLFKTGINDPIENDADPANASFDSAKDSDKVFSAVAKSIDGQILSPTTEYDWDWAWSVANGSIVSISLTPFLANENKQLVKAADNVVDGRTTITATAEIITSPNASPDVSGSADVYVFICENPWPPADGDIWEPWQDEINNCTTAAASGCSNTNYEIYYCRDNGRTGTHDDLPAILSDNTIIRGTSLACSDGSGPIPCSGRLFNEACNAPGVGTCQPEVIKEAFFLREEISVSTTSLSVADGLIGETIDVNWDIIAGDPNINAYKLYWSTRSQNYNDFAEITQTGVSDNEDVVCSVVGASMQCEVINLTNNRKYYFNLVGFDASTAVETSYFGEESAVPTDSTAPLAPTDFSATPGDGEVYLSWTAPAGEAVDTYKVYYGTQPGIYGSAEDIGNDTEIIISGLTNDKAYWFTVSSLDQFNNESAQAAEQSATPAAAAIGFTSGGELILIWNTGGGGNYEIYYELID